MALEAGLGGLFAVSFEGLILTTIQGTCLQLNPVALEILGLAPNALEINFSHYQLPQFLGFESDPAWATWRESLSVGNVHHPGHHFRSQAQLTRADGQTAAITYAVIPQANGFLWILPPPELIQWQIAKPLTPGKLTEATYQAIVETQTEMVVRFLPDSTFTYVNPAYCQMLGRPPEELLGRYFLEVIPPDAQAMMREELQAMNTLTPQHPFRIVINPSIGHDGTQIWHEWTNTALFDRNGSIIEFQATGRDITADYNFTRTLKASKNRLQLAFDIAGMGYCDWDLKTNRLQWSDGYEQLVGLEPGTFDHRIETFMDLVHPADRNRVQAEIEAIIQSRQQRNIEFRIIKPSGEIAWFLARGTAIYDDQGNPVRFTGVDMDITAQKLREQELQYQRDLQELLFNESTDALFLVDPETVRIRDCNPRAVELFEAESKTELIGLVGHEDLHVKPLTPEEVADNIEQMRLKGFWSMEVEYQTRKGNRFWGNIASKPVGIAGQALTFVRITDVTQWKQVEFDLAASELRFRTIFDQANLGIAICQAPKYRITNSNSFLQNLLGYTATELADLDFTDITHPDDLPPEQALVQECLAGSRDHYQLEKRYIRKDGAIRWVNLLATVVRQADGSISYGFVFVKDISDRKAAELQLQASEARFRAIFEQAAFGIAYGSMSGDFIAANDAFCQLVGYGQVELQHLNFRDLTYPADLDLEEQLVVRLMTGEIPSYTLEKRYVRKDGSLIWVSISINKIFDEVGREVGGMGIVQDISQRKALEQELEVSRRKYQTLFEILPLGILITDDQGRMLEVNPASYPILGVPEEEEKRRGFNDQMWECYRGDGSFLPADEYPALMALRENRVIQGVEIGYRHPDGQLRWLDLTAAPIPIPGLGVVLTYQDVTRRKQTEQALREKDAMLNLALDAGKQGIFEVDLISGKFEVSSRYWEMLGYGKDEIQMSTIQWGNWLHPEERETVYQHFLEFARGEVPLFATEFRQRTQTGDWVWFYSTGIAVAWDETGKPTRMLGVYNHINDRKLAEQALQDKETSLRLALEAAHQGVWEIDLNTGAGRIDAGYATMLGYEPGELNQTLGTWIASLHPEDRQAIPVLLEDYILGRRDHYWAEFRMQTKAGNWKWILSMGKIVAWDDQGRPTRMLGTHTDIDQRKRAELRLARKAEQERLFAEISNDIRRSLEINQILEAAVNNIRSLLQADRVLILQFLPHQHGVTVAESVAPGLVSLHHRCWLDFHIPEACIQEYLSGDFHFIDEEARFRCNDCWIPSLTDGSMQSKIIAPINQSNGQGTYVWGVLLIQCQQPHPPWQQDDGDLMARLCQQLAIAIQQAELYESLQAANAELQAANQELEYLARYDGLTQVANRRHFDEHLANEWQRMEREQKPLGLVMCDIDFFKVYNDHYGHIAGDSCLRAVARALRQTINRAGDLVARYGGEEFALILPNTDLAGTRAIAAKIQAAIADLQLPHAHSEIASHVTLSLGLVSLVPGSNLSSEILISWADAALYEAKQTGRNRYCWYPCP